MNTKEKETAYKDEVREVLKENSVDTLAEMVIFYMQKCGELELVGEANRYFAARERCGGVGKTAIVGIKKRNGGVVAQVVERTDKATLHGMIEENVAKGSNVYTDTHAGYTGLQGYNHETVCHSVGEYVRAKAHTNGIESFWALLKKGYYGIFHHFSAKHMQRYIQEFSFRYNTKEAGTMGFIEMTVDRMENKRLTYKELIAG